jgi:hypothetical protein
MRDVWRQKDLGIYGNSYTVRVLLARMLFLLWSDFSTYMLTDFRKYISSCFE